MSAENPSPPFSKGTIMSDNEALMRAREIAASVTAHEPTKRDMLRGFQDWHPAVQAALAAIRETAASPIGETLAQRQAREVMNPQSVSIKLLGDQSQSFNCTTPPAATTVGEVERLREALEPFAKEARGWDADRNGGHIFEDDTLLYDTALKLGALRRARALLTPTSHAKDQA